MKYLILVLTVLITLTAVTHAAIPEVIAFQGRLADTQGVPLTGSYNLTFRLYDVETGGSSL